MIEIEKIVEHDDEKVLVIRKDRDAVICSFNIKRSHL